MGVITTAALSGPGTAYVDIVGADEATVRQIAELLSGTWTTSGPPAVRLAGHGPGQATCTGRVYLDTTLPAPGKKRVLPADWVRFASPPWGARTDGAKETCLRDRRDGRACGRQVPRRHSGASAAFVSLYLTGSQESQRTDRWGVGVEARDVLRWARARDFPAARHATPGRPEVDTVRLRQTALERRQHPVAHSRRTLNDVYLKGSSTVRVDSRRVVGAALRQEVAKARVIQSIPVFTAEFVAWARENLGEAAAQAGLEPRTLKDLLDAQRDTAAVACVDHLASPVAEPGQPCPASFLQCLSCENARALPHHLPVQLAVLDGIRQRRPHLDPPVWQARFRTPLQQLEEIIKHFTDAEHEQARADLGTDQQRLVDDLLDGRWDLR